MNKRDMFFPQKTNAKQVRNIARIYGFEIKWYEYILTFLLRKRVLKSFKRK